MHRNPYCMREFCGMRYSWLSDAFHDAGFQSEFPNAGDLGIDIMPVTPRGVQTNTGDFGPGFDALPAAPADLHGLRDRHGIPVGKDVPDRVEDRAFITFARAPPLSLRLVPIRGRTSGRPAGRQPRRCTAQRISGMPGARLQVENRSLMCGPLTSSGCRVTGTHPGAGSLSGVPRRPKHPARCSRPPHIDYYMTI